MAYQFGHRHPLHQDIREAWYAPFIGESHKALKKDVEEMYRISGSRANPDIRYTYYASIIQSSGSGKSRLVDEVSKEIFTIPFNIRVAPAENADVWPPPDNTWPTPDRGIRTLLEQWGACYDERGAYRRYLCFLAAVFSCATEAVQKLNVDRVTPAAWREYLQDNRRSLYKLIERTAELNASAMVIKEAKIKASNKYEGVNVDTELVAKAQDALWKLVQIVSPGADDKTLSVLLSFDDAHVLLVDRRAKQIYGEQSKTPLDILVLAIDDLRRPSRKIGGPHMPIFPT